MRLGREVLFFWNKIPVGYEPGFLIIYGFLVCWKQVSRGLDQVPSWLATGIQKLGMAFLKFRNRVRVGCEQVSNGLVRAACLEQRPL